LVVVTAVLVVIWALQLAMLVPLPVTALVTVAYVAYVVRLRIVRRS
jgi:hypothetical protein